MAVMIEIDVRSGIPIYRQIMDKVRRLIMTGQMKEGDQLEQVRALSGRLKVNPMTVSKAYSFLEQEGLVTRKRGVGLFVAHVNRSTQRRIKGQMLARAIDQAAALAVQMGISLEESRDEFEEHFKKYQSQKGETNEH